MRPNKKGPEFPLTTRHSGRSFRLNVYGYIVTKGERAVSGPARQHGATVKDVALRAGVSVATVSRVMNEQNVVREPTVTRVRTAMEALNYVPHGGARSLSTRRTNTVGLVLPDLHGEFFSEMIRGVDVAARRRGYHLLVSGSHSDWSEMGAVVSAVRGRVDGLIVMAPELDAESVHSHLPAGLPAVLLNCYATNSWSIAIDNVRGARSVMDHLGMLGHRRIAFIRGPEGNNDAAERLRGWSEGLLALGVEQDGLLFDGDFSETAGYDAAYAILSVDSRPTAIFAANDAMAIGALCALRELNVRVPEDIAVVGFDDIPLARFVSPPLTTISVDIAELGRRAFELVLEAGTEGSTPRLEVVPTRLVIRESCGSRLHSARPVKAVSESKS